MLLDAGRGVLRAHFKRWKGEENELLKTGHERYGPAWGLISRQLPGRSPSECRKHWLKEHILPTLMVQRMPNRPTGPGDQQRKLQIARVTEQARLAGISPSPLFPDVAPSKMAGIEASEEWSFRLAGYDKVVQKSENPGDGVWILFPEEKRPADPCTVLSADLPRNEPRYKVVGNGWSEAEDMVLREAYEHHGPNWISIHYHLPKRTWQECRKRLSLFSATWNPITSTDDTTATQDH